MTALKRLPEKVKARVEFKGLAKPMSLRAGYNLPNFGDRTMKGVRFQLPLKQYDYLLNYNLVRAKD